MKIRSDFVTNSSSSSFILAQKGDFTEEQKAAILKYVAENMLGKALLTPESSEEEIQKVFEDNYMDETNQKKIRQALAEGKTIRYGRVNFECCEEEHGDLFYDLWNLLEHTSPDSFSAIDGDLSY